MIRLVFALRKKQTLSRAEFQDYWLNKHAPLVASVASDLDLGEAINTLRRVKNAVVLSHYYQHHALQDIADYAGDPHDLSSWPADTDSGVGVLWRDSSMSATAEMRKSTRP